MKQRYTLGDSTRGGKGTRFHSRNTRKKKDRKILRGQLLSDIAKNMGIGKEIAEYM
jgi:hypothetical protein